jgi:LacI family transcriptional regulator
MGSHRPAGSGSSPAATLYDVARTANVSIATVSRVVNGLDGVRLTTRQRVLDAIEALGYVPDGAAQSLAQRRKEVIGLVAVESRGPETDIEREGFLFIEEVLRGVERPLGELGWSVLISLLRGAGVAGAYQRMQKISAKVDGMIIAEGLADPAQLAQLAKRVPIALVAAYPQGIEADAFGVDNHSGMTAEVRHLIERHGSRRLFYITGPSDAPDARERHRAFLDAVAAHPGAAVAGTFEGWFAAISGQQAVRELLTWPRRDLPDAIVCGNDQTAIGAMRELQAAGIRVPADIGVVGFDDMHLSSMLAPPLTTVRQPMRQLGERACSRLLQRIADPSLPPEAVRLPAELIIRESCGSAPRPAAAAAVG